MSSTPVAATTSAPGGRPPGVDPGLTSGAMSSTSPLTRGQLLHLSSSSESADGSEEFFDARDTLSPRSAASMQRGLSLMASGPLITVTPGSRTDTPTMPKSISDEDSFDHDRWLEMLRLQQEEEAAATAAAAATDMDYLQQTEYERHRRLARVSRLQRGVAAAEGDCDEDEDRPHQRGGGRHLLDSDDLSGGHLSDEGDEAIAEQQSSAEFIQLRTGEEASTDPTHSSVIVSNANMAQQMNRAVCQTADGQRQGPSSVLGRFDPESLSLGLNRGVTPEEDGSTILTPTPGNVGGGGTGGGSGGQHYFRYEYQQPSVKSVGAKMDFASSSAVPDIVSSAQSDPESASNPPQQGIPASSPHGGGEISSSSSVATVSKVSETTTALVGQPSSTSTAPDRPSRRKKNSSGQSAVATPSTPPSLSPNPSSSTLQLMLLPSPLENNNNSHSSNNHSTININPLAPALTPPSTPLPSSSADQRPFCLQLSLISPANSCEMLPAPFVGPTALEARLLAQRVRRIRHPTISRVKERCYEHVTHITCAVLVTLFIFNMTLYSYIFYLAHKEGHDF